MMEPDRAELQRLAQLVEVNRERLQALEQQIRNLEAIKVEQEHAIEALDSISEEGAKGAMVPLGAGVQLVADIPSDAGAVIDIGSRVQAEKTRGEATEILRKRNEELTSIMDTLRIEYEELEKHVVELATRFNDTVEGAQQTVEETEQGTQETTDTPVKRRTRRKRGTELTLDD
tara:strand:+ start:740 stop:1261 length:522 start_codon:yes stop_codon:yes gene_type:complete